MKNITVVLSLMALVFTVTSCTKSCGGNKQTTPPAEEKAVDGKPAQEDPNKPAASATPEEGVKDTNDDKAKLKSEWKLEDGQKLFAVINTNQGTIKAELYWDKVPSTVWNFAALATGKKEWTNAKSRAKETTPLYNGTVFHRVIKGFMIQGGDPEGTGMGGPGYRFKDEFHPELKHDRAGILSMANAGPNTNGSQFFITEGPTPHLDNRHAVFGAVVEGLEIVNKIANVKTGAADRPENDVVITKIDIING